MHDGEWRDKLHELDDIGVDTAEIANAARLLGKWGAKARNAKLTPAERSQAARAGGLALWQKIRALEAADGHYVLIWLNQRKKLHLLPHGLFETVVQSNSFNKCAYFIRRVLKGQAFGDENFSIVL